MTTRSDASLVSLWTSLRGEQLTRRERDRAVRTIVDVTYASIDRLIGRQRDVGAIDEVRSLVVGKAVLGPGRLPETEAQGRAWLDRVIMNQWLSSCRQTTSRAKASARLRDVVRGEEAARDNEPRPGYFSDAPERVPETVSEERAFVVRQWLAERVPPLLLEARRKARYLREVLAATFGSLSDLTPDPDITPELRRTLKYRGRKALEAMATGSPSASTRETANQILIWMGYRDDDEGPRPAAAQGRERP